MRCAAAVVRQFDLKPPVDVRAIAENYCDIDEIAWPHECDAITLNLGMGRPRVFLRKNDVSRLRQRFTLGHELGHIRMTWHLGTAECSVDQASLAASQAGSHSQEAEAHRFAGALLVPRSFVERYAANDVGDAVAALDKTDISAFAAVLSFTRNLQLGFCFLVEKDRDVLTVIKSSGTELADISEGRKGEAQLRAKAYDSGQVVVSGRRVLWFQLAAPASLSPSADGRSAKQLLGDAIAQAGRESESRALTVRINSIVGGLLSKEDRAQSVTVALTVLEYRFPASHPDLKDFMDIPDFRLYLRKRAAARVERAATS